MVVEVFDGISAEAAEDLEAKKFHAKSGFCLGAKQNKPPVYNVKVCLNSLKFSCLWVSLWKAMSWAWNDSEELWK